MAFDSLSFQISVTISNFPERWFNLTHLYDADLPLFPVYYFHVISKQLLRGQRASFGDRVFGYVERIAALPNDQAELFIVTNKDLSLQRNQHFAILVEDELKERFGVSNPVTIADVNATFTAPLTGSNQVLKEIWHRVVADTYGDQLPFGRLWDEILGLTRFVASFYSNAGRKGELIQTHYFCSKFGVRIQSSGSIKKVDFYLLPTIDEILDTTNPLSLYPDYSKLVELAEKFQIGYCTTISVLSSSLSKFSHPPRTGNLSGSSYHSMMRSAAIPPYLSVYATECFNAFGKGAHRTIIFLMMLSDLRSGRLNYRTLTSADFGALYDQLGKTYQSPKVINIYAQQSFGNTSAVPIDLWIETFLKWPLNVRKVLPKQATYQFLLSKSNNIGKVERLIWMAAQARKVHSSACNDALWCIKKATNGGARGANPLACKICILRPNCPAYQEIKLNNVSFNAASSTTGFNIVTSQGNTTTPNQSFVLCNGKSIYSEVIDDFSSKDSPQGFSSYPNPNQRTAVITVTEFMTLY